MTVLDKDELRMGILTTLVKRAPKPPGRTALMKFAYLLQTIRGIPLGYRFRLYNYGPYDEQVLADARSAESNGWLTSQLVTYQSGYGYEFEASEDFHGDEISLSDVSQDCEEGIDWVIEQFGDESASRLELISTLVFALCDKDRRRENEELIARVHEIKPHFSIEEIDKTADEISAVLDCVTCGK